MDQDTPKVSVIIPTYNRQDLIVETIQSVLSQTMSDVEIIVVDDGSSDGTGELLRTQFDQKVRYFYQENQGRAVARNRGVQEARGQYLLFLDSDDLLLPDGLASQAAFLDANPDVAVVYSDGYYCDAEGRNRQRISLERPPVDHDNLLEILILTNIVVAIHAAMVRRTALIRLGYPYFDETLCAAEDADMWLRLAAQGARFAYLDSLTCKYRLHETNSSLKELPGWRRHWQSLVRSKYKALRADFFATLSPATRRSFLYEFLLFYLQDDVKGQEEILQSPQFRTLPLSDQARLLYDVGVDNIVYGHPLELGRKRLQQSVAIDGEEMQYRLVLFLSQLGAPVIRQAISWRRKLAELRRRGAVDYSVAPHARLNQ